MKSVALSNNLKAVGLGLCLVLAGCQQASHNADDVVSGQKPGVSSGAGATFTGPANSGAPSTQVAQRRAGFYPSPIFQKFPRFIGAAKPAETHAEAAVRGEGTPPTTETAEAPSPAWIDEKVTTTYGQHQDAAGIVKVANALNQWGKMRWIGILCLFVAYSGLLWCHGNAEGYPVVCWKIGACGLVFVVLDASLWWLLLLLIPAGFYLAQKMNLLRLPGIP